MVFHSDTTERRRRAGRTGLLLIFIGRLLLWMRYKKHILGCTEILRRGSTGILFLSNHPGLIDPVLMYTILYPKFAPRAIADEYQVDRPILRTICRIIGVKPIPNLERRGIDHADEKGAAIDTIVQWLRNGDNVLLYPAGHIKRAYKEEIGASNSVAMILAQLPDVRIVLVRQNGIWGSSFSYGFSGKAPQVGAALLSGMKYLLYNCLLFMPRRHVKYEFIEAADLPRNAGREDINAWLEHVFNENAQPNTYVPYIRWTSEKTRYKEDPEMRTLHSDASAVPAATRDVVFNTLRELSGIENISGAQRLNFDLGLDSLHIAELNAWLHDEFGFDAGTPESLRVVDDVLLTAAGQGVSIRESGIRSAPKKWFGGDSSQTLTCPEGETLASVFLAQARRYPSRIVVADQLSGVLSYRHLVRAILAMSPMIKAEQGEYFGIMLPASVASVVSLLAVWFSAKIPVMINWTTGVRTVRHSLELLGVHKIITSRKLLQTLKQQGYEVAHIESQCIFLEDFKSLLSVRRKLGVFIQSYLPWHLKSPSVSADSPAVVLFTSGSETVPKAVPLSHTNILTNIHDILTRASIYESDKIIGMLPPFHSFGLTATVVLPLLCGVRVMYHANPTESAHIAGLIDEYKISVMLGTPSFLNGILRACDPSQLSTLRLAVTGAEKCPESVYTHMHAVCPDMMILEGYGVTECAPIIAVNSDRNPVPYTIGAVLPSYEYAIVHSETYKRVPQGAIGLLLVRGQSVFSGYLKYSGVSPFVPFDGRDWYATGDLVSEDEQGILTFRGREKRFVKIGGEMISLPAIESVLSNYYAHIDTEGSACAVEATANDQNPEIVLFTILDITREEVNRVIRDSGLSPLHNVRKVIIIEAIPMLGNGKTDYRSLKRILSENDMK